MSHLRIGVADESLFHRQVIAQLVAQEPGMEVVGMASSNDELLRRLEQRDLDAVVVDLTAADPAGARMLPAERSRRTAAAAERLAPAAEGRPARTGGTGSGGVDLVVLGASAGGPQAIERVLCDLGGELTVPMAIAQHMPPAFTRCFADRLDGKLALRVREARHGEALLGGVVYIAPGDCHLRIERRGEELRAALSPLPESAPCCPSVDALFASAAIAARGRLVAVLLTGMGCDGAAAMAQLAGAGVHTIAQDGATSAIFGMPRAAIEAGGADEVLPLQGIGPRLLQLIQR
jgi:two-component system chemotaxis response regulator CheB